jgi:histidine kinase
VRRGRAFRRHLGWKLLASYLLTIGVGAAVLWATALAVAPASFSQHITAMAHALGPRPDLQDSLLRSFLGAMNTALLVAVGAAAVTAAAVSLFTTRRIVAPIRLIQEASQRIAEGRYGERVPLLTEDELGDLALQFNRMADALEQTEKRRRDLIADVAHELRTPLASIAGYAEGLVDGVLPATPDVLHRVYREATRLQRLVDDLQELSRAEAGQLPLHLRSVNVDDLVETAAARLRPQFEEKGVTLTVAPAGDLPPVLGDPDRLVQVLTNLLGNALQYTPPGGSAEVRTKATGSFVEVAVVDTGIGIAPEHLPHIFDRFYRVDRSRSRASGGTGIGLTIARHLVEAHGGSITASSPGPGRGSTFTVRLPRAR